MTRKEQAEKSINNINKQIELLNDFIAPINVGTAGQLAMIEQIRKLEETKLQFIWVLEEKELLEEPKKETISVDQSFFEGKNE